MDRPVGRAAGRPAAGDRPRALRRRHQFPAPASHAHRALQPRARQHLVDRHRRRARTCRAWSRCGRQPTSPTCRRSISAKARSRSLRPIASRCWRTGKVRYVGEPVAAVFADDAYVAEDAADLVTMEIEELPPLLSARDDARRVLVRPRHRSRDADARAMATSKRCSSQRAHIVELKLTSGRHSGVPLETAARIGRYDASRDVLELHGAAKVPHRNKELIARMLEPHAVVGQVLRIPCRRRLRHPRRALPRRHTGLRRRDAASSGR